MSDALLVLVDCEPYRARLLATACADRWRVANGRYTASEVPGSAGIRASLCKSCPIGEQRSGGVTTVPLRVNRIVRAKTLVIPGQPEPAPVPVEQEMEMFQKKKCESCPKIFQPTGSRSTRCDDCRENASGGGSKIETRPAAIRKTVAARQSVPLLAPAPRPPLTIYLEKAAAIEELKAQHLVELAAMTEELERFEKDNPSVLAAARDILERITKAA